MALSSRLIPCPALLPSLLFVDVKKKHNEPHCVFVVGRVSNPCSVLPAGTDSMSLYWENADSSLTVLTS